MLTKLGFGWKWRRWVYAIVKSSFISVLVNGSPQKSSSLSVGSSKVTSLPLFIFLVAMEGLAGLFINAVREILHSAFGYKILIKKKVIY